ncbi:DDE-type integrase/transposase/recombinase [Tropicimonas marinistellae]|uniref:DDE-type integrase/transposase/recombinase n=1 Tax=Tropicimonas marinistellae TaxID=1739787 RepID=UPI00098FDCDA
MARTGSVRCSRWESGQIQAWTCRPYSEWERHVDESLVKEPWQATALWRAFDHGGVVLEAVVAMRRNKPVALKSLRNLVRRYCHAAEIITHRFPSHGVALRVQGADARPASGGWFNNRAEASHLPLRQWDCVVQRMRLP